MSEDWKSRALRAEAELAAAREAMPTQDEYDRVYDAFEGEIMEARKSRREWLAPGAAWLDRLHAYRAAQTATSAEQAKGGECAACDGSGYGNARASVAGATTCPECNGTGKRGEHA